MGWFVRWLERKLNENQEVEASAIGRDVSEDYGEPLQINVYNAIGGKIVRFYHYSRTKDKTTNTTYIIHPDENLADSLSKLIATEELKR